ncbi:hypothetical protein FB1_29200 [Flavobacterium branchiophilum NBRC 15030 = ATCC 35035]|nr:hypothetical protein FB1_29200 [Flavobacterium branchiophilum NBRC 15030 = ATCC 35035]
MGTLGIGVMTLLESDTIFTSTGEEETNSNFKELQKEITTFENKSNWKLTDYKIAEVSITTSAEAELISGTTKGNLLTTLNNALEQKTFQRCEAYLSSSVIENPSELKELLNTLLNVVASSSKINFYKTQIEKYIYYEKVLPNKVNNFTGDLYNYSDDQYNYYLNQVTNMPGFDSKYKNHSKFRTIARNLKINLDSANFKFYNSEEDDVNPNN